MSISSLQKSIASRINELGAKKNNVKDKACYTHFHKRLLLDFVHFIDNPHCFSKAMHSLYYCQSTYKPLQARQRINLVKLVTVLFTYMDVENNQIGVSDKESMKTVSHKSIHDEYEKVWGEPITFSKYYRLINLLKLAGYIKIEAIFVHNTDVLANPNFKEGDLDTIKSIAAYKSFTDKFVNIFIRLYEIKDVMTSMEKSIKKRKASGLRNIWDAYKPFSNSYFHKKKVKNANLKREEELRYPQRLS